MRENRKKKTIYGIKVNYKKVIEVNNEHKLNVYWQNNESIKKKIIHLTKG